MKNIYPLLLLLPALIISGCKDDDDNTPATPTGLIYSYYPVNVGHELVYDVELITKNEFSGAEDTVYYQLKEVIESIFNDNQGRPTQRLERYTRPTSADPWPAQPDDVWTSNLTNSWVEKKEENITFVKMVFPMNPSITWNGNVLNTLGDQTYRYQDMHMPLTLGSLQFDSTLVVVQSDEDNFVFKAYAIEKYANGIGMIYKNQVDIVYDHFTPGANGVKSQRLYKETLISYSN